MGPSSKYICPGPGGKCTNCLLTAVEVIAQTQFVVFIYALWHYINAFVFLDADQSEQEPKVLYVPPHVRLGHCLGCEKRIRIRGEISQASDNRQLGKLDFGDDIMLFSSLVKGAQLFTATVEQIGLCMKEQELGMCQLGFKNQFQQFRKNIR